ncbi:putative transcriptional regulator [Thiovulum sp. ES]|nr:putative transcriptional regulator [Thiovulum sp. ES]
MEQKEAKNEENLVKKTCRELGITQKELAEYFGVTPKAVSNWATQKHKLPTNFYFLIDLIKTQRKYNSLMNAINNH